MKNSKPPRIVSFALDPEDEKNLDKVKDHIGTKNQSVAIRFSLKETARRLLKRLTG